jgi:sulfur-oxidizing protein SoxY
MRWWFFLCAGLAFSSVAIGDDAVHDTRASGLPDPETAIWKKLKSSLFENRPMSGDALELVAPMRAEDGAVVPIAIRARLSQSSKRYVRRLLPHRGQQPVAGRGDD